MLAHPKLNPNFVRREDDPRLDLGSIAHAALLENSFDNIVVVDADDWRKKESQAKRDDAWATGKHTILKKNMDAVVQMVETAKNYVAGSELSGVFDHGKAEQTITWKEQCGAWCRIRPDWLTDGGGVCIDYKTTKSAHPEAFIRQIQLMGYDTQAEFYSKGIRWHFKRAVTFVFLVQEITPPYACSLVALSEAYKTIAAGKVMQGLITWAECLATDTWPSYPARICYAEPKTWQVMEYEAGQLESEE
jgi:hypothetical protein